jgi:glycosyltransferase involved in cell wall biosynthesis
MAGSDYDPGYAAAVRARSSADVELRGALGRERVWELMAGARALLCPICWEEPFGLTAAEAQAAGTPVVGFDRGALREVIRDGRTGFLVPPGDVEGAAEAAASADRLVRSEIRRHAETNLSLQATLDAHEALYRGILEGRRRGSRPRAGVPE